MAFNITTISSLVPEKYYFGQPPEAIASTVIAVFLLVTAAEILPQGLCIGIKNGKISCIAQTLSGSPSTRLIDAEGAYVTPGGIDSHVHLDQDNAPTGDKWLSGTRSALAGGTTTVIAFATQKKTDESLYPVVEDYHRRSSNQSYVDYGFHLILSNPTRKVVEEELPSMMHQEGITSVKLYMTYDRLKLTDEKMLEVMLQTRQLGMTTMIHAENSDMIEVISKRLLERGHTLPAYHANARPQIAESEATYRAISLSTLTSTPILIVHMSSPPALAHARKAQEHLLPVHAETCPHYLYLLSDNLKASETDAWAGAKHVCAPPLRHSASDLDALWRSMSNGTITVVSSDHAPSVYDHPQGKRKPLTISDTPVFTQIPNGLPGIETRLPLLFHAATSTDPQITLPKYVELTSANAAKIYGLSNVKGSIAPGYDADLTIWYPPEDARGFTTIANTMLHHSIDYTPFEGFKVSNWPRWTILRGEIAWNRDHGGVLGVPGQGKFLKRAEGEVIVGKTAQGVPGMTSGERHLWMDV